MERLTIGIVGGGNVGDIGGDVHDCVGRWETRDGAREEIEG